MLALYVYGTKNIISKLNLLNDHYNQITCMNKSEKAREYPFPYQLRL